MKNKLKLLLNKVISHDSDPTQLYQHRKPSPTSSKTERKIAIQTQLNNIKNLTCSGVSSSRAKREILIQTQSSNVKNSTIETPAIKTPITHFSYNLLDLIIALHAGAHASMHAGVNAIEKQGYYQLS